MPYTMIEATAGRRCCATSSLGAISPLFVFPPVVGIVEQTAETKDNDDAADSGAHTKRSGGVSGAEKGRWQKADDQDNSGAPQRREKRDGRRPPAPAPDDMNPYADPDKALKSWEARWVMQTLCMGSSLFVRVHIGVGDVISN